jgi:hypothetical protein
MLIKKSFTQLTSLHYLCNMIGYDNDPELNGKYLGTITSDFVKIASKLKEASYQLRSRKITEYPIFVVSKMNTEIGQLFINKHEENINWNINASLIDEFLQRGLVDNDKEEDFKRVYRNPDEFCCLFVLDYDFTRFIFLPYPNDLDNDDLVE